LNVILRKYHKIATDEKKWSLSETSPATLYEIGGISGGEPYSKKERSGDLL